MDSLLDLNRLGWRVGRYWGEGIVSDFLLIPKPQVWRSQRAFREHLVHFAQY